MLGSCVWSLEGRKQISDWISDSKGKHLDMFSNKHAKLMRVQILSYCIWGGSISRAISDLTVSVGCWDVCVKYEEIWNLVSLIMVTSVQLDELNVIVLIHSSGTDYWFLTFALFLSSFVFILKPRRPSGSYKTWVQRLCWRYRWRQVLEMMIQVFSSVHTGSTANQDLSLVNGRGLWWPTFLLLPTHPEAHKLS